MCPENTKNPTVTLQTTNLTRFVECLTPEALDIVNKSKAREIDKTRVVFFSGQVQHPAKMWYEEVMAGVFNRLVKEGVATGLLGGGAIKLVSGPQLLDLVGTDSGPDEHDLVYMFVESTATKEALNTEIGEELFLQEGQIGRRDTNWGKVWLYANNKEKEKLTFRDAP